MKLVDAQVGLGLKRGGLPCAMRFSRPVLQSCGGELKAHDITMGDHPDMVEALSVNLTPSADQDSPAGSSRLEQQHTYSLQ